MSRRPSATKRTVRPPEHLVYFIDRSLGSRFVADALRAAGATVELHRDHFADDAPDVEWLEVVGKRRWIVLTKDDAIRRNPLERRALLAYGVRAFILTSQQMSGPEMAQLVVRWRPRVEALAKKTPAPFIALVTRSAVTLAHEASGRR